MIAQVRIGAVGYLNARPLTWALDRRPDRWLERYDVPAVCAALLHEGKVDLGLSPSIEYLQSEDYRFVPGVGIGSRGPVASVALYTRMPVRPSPCCAVSASRSRWLLRPHPRSRGTSMNGKSRRPPWCHLCMSAS